MYVALKAAYRSVTSAPAPAVSPTPAKVRNFTMDATEAPVVGVAKKYNIFTDSADSRYFNK
jgi:hypothetical protein